MIVSISGKIGSGKDTVAKIWQLIHMGHKVDDIRAIIVDGALPVQSFYNGYTPWEVRKFADKLKETIALWLGVKREMLEIEAFKNTILPENWDKYVVYNWNRETTKVFVTEVGAQVYCDINSNSQHRYTWKRERMTIRKLMLLLGTEAGRDVIHPNIWINTLFGSYTPATTMLGTESKWLITDCRFQNELAAVLERGGLAIRVNRRRRVNDNQVLEKAIDYLDLVNPNPDAIQEIAKRMDLEWDEREEKWIDTLGLFNLTHESETALDNSPFSVVIDNEGSLEDLYNKLLPIYEEVCNQKT